MTHDLANTLASTLCPLLAVDLDTIVFLVVVGVSLLGRLFGKKDPEHAEEWIGGEDWKEQQSKREEAGQQMLDWEAEMRRLLEGKAPEPKKAPPPLPLDPQSIVIIPPVPAASATKSHLAKAEEAYRKARELKAQAAARMAEVGALQPAKAHHRGGRSKAAQSVINQLRRPHTARQAIIATTILGPAKGLQ